MFSPNKPPPVRVNVDHDPRIQQAIREIASTYSDNVSVQAKRKSLLKFGRSDDIDTAIKTVWMNTTETHETLVSSNLINRVSSSNAGDTQTITIEGHTISGSDLTFATQNATLNGQTPVTLTTALARATRLYNTSSTDFAGDIWVYQSTSTVTAGVPDTKSLAHLIASGTVGLNQSEKAQTAISSQDYWIITQVKGSVLTKSSASVEFQLQIKRSGQVFRTAMTLASHFNRGANTVNLDPYIIAPKNSDVRMVAKSSAINTEVEAWINGYLAIVQ